MPPDVYCALCYAGNKINYYDTKQLLMLIFMLGLRCERHTHGCSFPVFATSFQLRRFVALETNKPNE